MVIISTRAVATIIHAVSAPLISEASAIAGDPRSKTATPIGAANFAARVRYAPMIFPQPVDLLMASRRVAGLYPVEFGRGLLAGGIGSSTRVRARRCRFRRCVSAAHD